MPYRWQAGLLGLRRMLRAGTKTGTFRMKAHRRPFKSEHFPRLVKMNLPDFIIFGYLRVF